jgi:hypothetical protein
VLVPFRRLVGVGADDCRRRLNNHPPLPVEKSPTPAA